MGGKNKFGPNASPSLDKYLDASANMQMTSGWRVSNWVSVTPATTYTFNPNSSEGQSAKSWFYDADKTPISYIASGPQTFTTPANCYYMRFSYRDASFDVQLEIGKTATSYAPYSNICPISGWTGAKVTRCGKNFVEIDSAWIGRSGTHNGITWRFNEDGSVTLNGKKTISTASVLVWNFANAASTFNPQSDNKKHIPNGDYYIYSGHNKVTLQVYGSNDENANQNNSYSIASGNLNPVGFTINDTYKYNWIRLNIGGSAVFDNYTFYPMVQLASDTGTEQAPYTGDTYSITFPSETGTVYGGTVDATTGKLTVTMGYVDLGLLSWELVSGTTSDYDFFKTTNLISTIVPGTMIAICENYKVVDAIGTSAGGNCCLRVDGSKYIRIRDLSYSNASSFKTAMDGVLFVYELATPQTYQLTPTEVTTFLGDNTIWADTGDVTVTY